jgi:hypothetical protein
MNRVLSVAVSIAATMVPCIALGVAVPHPSLSQMVGRARVVAVVKVVSNVPFNSSEDSEYFRVNALVSAVLKGDLKPGEKIQIQINNSIHELAVHCCTLGSYYVVFLNPSRMGVYATVGGPSGVVWIR